MEIRWLEAFIAVAEELHFGRAARRLRMAQSPLSQTIRKLEKELGTALFERNTRSVALTGAGHSLLPHAYRVLEELELAHQATRAAIGTVYGHVTIGFSGALNNLSLPPLTRALRRRYPNVSLTLVGRVLTADAVAQLQQGTLDLAFVGLPMDPSPLATRLIAREALGAALPVDHPLAHRPAVALADLADEDFISLPLHVGSALQETMMRACIDGGGFRPRVIQEITDPYMILTLVAAGVGVSLITEGVSRIMPSGSVFVPLAGDPVYYLEHGIAWSPDNPSSVLTVVLDVAADVLPTPEGG